MSGRYKAYGEYKESGVEWLGEIPREWSALMGKRIFSSIRKTALKDDVQLAVSQKYGVLPQSLMMLLNDSKVMLALKGIDSFRHVDQNDFVISLRSFEGGIEYSKYSGCVSPAYTVLNNVKKISHNYYKYLLKCAPFISALQSTTDSLRDGKSISYEQFGAICLPLTRLSEQNQIAAFLDHETAKIDTLIDKQQQLIELLIEKRQAVINHAVTKGLDPDVQMKDSGVEWLGEVPQTWEMWKLAHAFEVIGSGTTPSSDNDSWFEGDIPWVTTGELRETVITHTIKKVSKLTLERFSALKIHPVGSVVIAMYGATIGRLGILGVKSTTNQACCVLTFSRVIDNKYLYYWLGGYKDDIIRLSSGGGQPNINQEKVASLKISSPILKEQTQIATFLDYETAKIDKLIDLQLLQIELLKERRTALISAAVTGKIDVRDWQVPVTQTESDEVMA